MNVYDPLISPESANDLDDPYIHPVSTEELVQTVERASQEETNEKLTSRKD